MRKEITQTDITKSVKISKQNTYVSSDFIAEVFDKRHDNILALIENTQVSLLKIKESTNDYFVDASYVNSRGKTYRKYNLTRKGFDLVALSFTGEKALKYKVWFIEVFHKKAEVLTTLELNKNNSLVQTIRGETKPARDALTDAIQRYELPQRVAEGKAHEKFVETRIMNYTKLLNKVLDIEVIVGVSTRDTLSPRMLFKLEELEYKIAKQIQELTELNGCHYKQTYKLIKKGLL